MAEAQDELNRLIEIMAALRGEGGCPWDRQQTHETLKRYLLEETYELIEAIDSRDDDRLAEELGDLLLQIIFHAQVARERGVFDIQEVARRINEKLVRRHPHVFEGREVRDLAELWHNWENIKQEEKAGRAGQDGSPASVLDGVPGSLPALLRAYVTQRKAAHVGWEGPDAGAALEKAVVQMKDLAADGQEAQAAQAALGELLFSLVTWACRMDVDPEDALRQAVDRFCDAFSQVENGGPD